MEKLCQQVVFCQDADVYEVANTMVMLWRLVPAILLHQAARVTVFELCDASRFISGRL